MPIAAIVAAAVWVTVQPQPNFLFIMTGERIHIRSILIDSSSDLFAVANKRKRRCGLGRPLVQLRQQLLHRDHAELLLRPDAQPRCDGQGQRQHSLPPCIRWQRVLQPNESSCAHRAGAAANLHRQARRAFWWTRVGRSSTHKPGLGAAHSCQCRQAGWLYNFLHGQGKVWQ